MARPRLMRKLRNSRRATHDMILAMVKYGNHRAGAYKRYRTDADVKRVFERGDGPGWNETVEECRDWGMPVPFFEEMLGSTWEIEGHGGSVALVEHSPEGERELVKMTGGGQLITSAYQHLYETAARALERAIEGGDWGEYLSALSMGVASVEAYINHRVDLWNRTNATDQLHDSKAAKVSFTDKIDRWIPKMAGKKLDKSDEVWPDFVLLQQLRDQQAIHVKNQVVGVSLEDLAERINRFRTGIARLLIRLHQLFEEPVPARIIRGAYAPEVEVVKASPEPR